MVRGNYLAFLCLGWLIIFVCVHAGCGAAEPQQSDIPAVEVQRQSDSGSQKEPGYVEDPTCCGFIVAGNQGIDKAWQLFTKDGRYRLARKEDIKYPARAFGDENPFNSIFAYCWGPLGYDSHKDHWYHLAAIVVDTNRTDNARFGLVIFSSPSNGDGSYKPYWLYQNRDLSQTVVWTGSGDLMLAEYKGDGSRNVLFVSWDRQRKQYVTSKSRPKPA